MKIVEFLLKHKYDKESTNMKFAVRFFIVLPKTTSISYFYNTKVFYCLLIIYEFIIINKLIKHQF